MTTISRAFANILSDKLPETRDFYTGLLGFQVAYDSDWFIYLWAPQSSLNELGIWRRDHELVPAEYQTTPQGMILIFVATIVTPFMRGQWKNKSRSSGRQRIFSMGSAASSRATPTAC